MPTNGFIYWGRTKGDAENKEIIVPYPTKGKALFESEWAFEGERNANNVLVGQFVGRDIDKQNMGWDRLEPEKWWEMNRFRKSVTNIFYCHYFSHNLGYWMTRRFYSGNPKANPMYVDPITGVPKYYIDVTLNIIDIGEGD